MGSVGGILASMTRGCFRWCASVGDMLVRVDSVACYKKYIKIEKY